MVGQESLLKEARRIVVKVGSALVTNDGRGLDVRAIERWAGQIAALRAMGREVLLVSSGAIAEGVLRIGWETRPTRVCELQAAAAVGQMGLAQAYEEHFGRHGIKTAQVLLTHANLADREQYLNARMTLIELLGLGIVPVINENDTVVTEEIKVGDNDTLGALVTNLVEADVLVIPALEKMAGGAASTLSKGGMITKILAAKRAARSGAGTIIASGREENVLVRLAQGEAIGTHLSPASSVLHAKKQWIADHLRAAGRLVLDSGAVRALKRDHTSLLPVGVKAVEGEFKRGEMVVCVDEAGCEIARGLVGYSSTEARRICRAHTDEVMQILGSMDAPEMIHRDNLVVL